MIRIVCYDISENKHRKWISDFLLEQGFERMQYSVFAGTIPTIRWKAAWERIAKYFEKNCAESDRIQSHVVEQDHFKQMSVLGIPPDFEWILQETQVWFS